jgi:hypothetical protein
MFKYTFTKRIYKYTNINMILFFINTNTNILLEKALVIQKKYKRDSKRYCNTKKLQYHRKMERI